MFRGLFGSKSTSKSDVIMAVAGALIGVWKAVDTWNDYKKENASDQAS